MPLQYARSESQPGEPLDVQEGDTISDGVDKYRVIGRAGRVGFIEKITEQGAEHFTTEDLSYLKTVGFFKE